MKRVLFASVFAAIALAANAQTQEVLRSKGNFDVVPKSLTTSGKNILYSQSINASFGKDVTFTFYDDNFLQTKSFRFVGKEFPQNSLRMKALAPITKKTVNSVEYDGVYSGDTLTVKTMDELVDWLQQLDFQGITKDDCFYDYEGNMAFHNRYDRQSVQNGTDVDGKPAAIIRETYYYYNKTDKMIHGCAVLLTAEFDVDNLNWEIEDSYSSMSNNEFIIVVNYIDYDNILCDGGWSANISQNLFNNDDKYEYVVTSFREISAPSDQNTTFDNGLTLGYEMEDGKLVINKQEYDHYYQNYLYVADEDGNKLFELPGTSRRDVTVYKLNGKLLLETQDNLGDGNTSNGLYLFDPETTGISEVARSQSAPADIFYNAAGIQVSKNAKGLVIQKDGKKFINR